MRVCIHEDRPLALVGVRLLVASLLRHCPGVEIVVSCPSPPGAFEDWIGARPVALRRDPALVGQGWNVKPRLLLDLLDEGAQEVVWIDSDVIVARDFRPLLEGRRDDLAVAEDHYWELYQGGTLRTELWGLATGRSLPATVSSSFVRVTPAHRELVVAWERLLRHPDYQGAQRRPVEERPVHLIGDQDVLNALLGSERFAELPVLFLKRGRDIVQQITPAGYAVHERWRNLGRELPPLIHCVEPKPWGALPEAASGGRLERYYDLVALELSPYFSAARPFRGELDLDLPGMQVRTLAGRLCRALAGRDPALQGLPQAAFHSLGKRLKRVLGLTRWPSTEGRVQIESDLP